MRVNVGLDTTSAVAAPRPSTIPLLSVVFPAPSSPIRRTTPRCGRIRASWFPIALVSSSESLLNVWTEFIDCIRQVLKKIRGHGAFLAHVLCRQFTTAPVQPHCRDYGLLPVLRMLGHQAADHSGQNVPGSAGCHGWRTGRVHP